MLRFLLSFFLFLPFFSLISSSKISSFYPNQFTTIDLIYPEMIFVEGGAYMMGCTSEQDDFCEDDEKPLHQVLLSSFYIAETEVTNEQYACFLNDANIPFNGKHEGTAYICFHENKRPIRYKKGSWVVDPAYSDIPVVCVTWYGAQAYCEWLGGRLPTEAEWEYAAGGGRESLCCLYAGDNDIDKVGWVVHNSALIIHPVAMKKPNELGIYDMSGNAWEWCHDWYSPAYSSSQQTDPHGPSEGYTKVMRGGSWDGKADYARITNRFNHKPENCYSTLGFRPIITEVDVKNRKALFNVKKENND